MVTIYMRIIFLTDHYDLILYQYLKEFDQSHFAQMASLNLSPLEVDSKITIWV
jgi:hypothetical protein